MYLHQHAKCAPFGETNPTAIELSLLRQMAAGFPNSLCAAVHRPSPSSHPPPPTLHHQQLPAGGLSSNTAAAVAWASSRPAAAAPWHGRHHVLSCRVPQIGSLGATSLQPPVTAGITDGSRGRPAGQSPACPSLSGDVLSSSSLRADG